MCSNSRGRLKVALAALALLMAACADEASPVVVTVGQAGYTGVVPAGSVQVFRVSVKAAEGTVESLEVRQQSAPRGTEVLLDSTIGAAAAEFDYRYLVPTSFVDDTVLVRLSFTARASGGASSTMELRLRVVAGAVLQTAEGLVLHSARSAQPGGLDLASLQPVYCAADGSDSVDIYDFLDSLSPQPDALSCEWRSGSGVLFAKFNHFDFANASAQSLNMAYASAVRHTRATGIADGDIILVGRQDTALGVIQVVSVIDGSGTDNDRYILNAKRK